MFRQDDAHNFITQDQIGTEIKDIIEIAKYLYGIFGLSVIVPSIQNIFNLPKGQSLFAVIIVLSIMMLPTIT